MSHTRKRPVQSSKITSFFPPSLTSSTSTPATPSYSSPVLPTQVQSSLLNVGMRVRKSVPEGYKTHKTLPSSQPTYSTYSTSNGMNAADYPAPPSSAPPALHRTSSGRENELQPFCGLHSTGSWASQPSVPELSGSQSTLSSTSSTYASSTASAGSVETSRKRRQQQQDAYDEEVEAEMDAVFAEQEEVQHIGERRIAKPRRRGGMVRTTGAMTGVQGDFEDGDVGFLAPMDVDF
ncbi:hypothetical protein K461DRAFT_292170 [Myriangium duriaei CBS 260.36]|uniref:Uncharacterized protein n=1 Tax=Myriangium duriaei CBS 260.36 TaxID=1168546 RepID=A0A9P4JAI5_9PEZI|nr:hypothetical protein K461DRAFT_292170 [Myriangium duriaei CBS 260.36]